MDLLAERDALRVALEKIGDLARPLRQDAGAIRAAMEEAIIIAHDALSPDFPPVDCPQCGGFGEVTGEYPGVACPACNGTGKTARAAGGEK